MKEYSNQIALIKNSRGIYSIDPIMGCESGLLRNKNGCYSECYAASYARRYGYDFGKNVRRFFDSDIHALSIRKKINRIDMPFVRMGTSGDPSEDWDHTFYVLENLLGINKEIVIITKHWKNIPDSLLKKLKNYKVCINTSVSALDYSDTLENSIEQYWRVKEFCNSVLRVVTCKFNYNNDSGLALNELQNRLISIDDRYIDTVLRISNKNELVLNGIVEVNELNFLGKKITASKNKTSTYFGKCKCCKEMCGINSQGESKKFIPHPKQYELIRAKHL